MLNSVRSALWQRGMTLVEQGIVLVVMGILLMLAVRGYSAWVQNLRIRAVAESINTGLQQARSEAIKRNAAVHFSLVNTLGSGCSLLSTNTDNRSWQWITSTADPVSNACPAAGNNTVTIQAGSSAEGSGSSDIRIKADIASLHFTGLARVSEAATYIVSRGGSANCSSAAESVRCMKIQVAYPGGQIRMCDPAVITTADPRKCD